MTLKPQTLLLGVVVVALAAIAGYWSLLAVPRDLPGAVVPDAAALRAQTVDAVVPDAALVQAIAARPLFIPGRRPLADDAQVTTDSASTSGGGRLVLKGVLGAGDVGVAILSRDGVVRRLSRGQVVDGWTLEQIDGRVARFSGAGGETMELKLEHLTQGTAGQAQAVPPPLQPQSADPQAAAGTTTAPPPPPAPVVRPAAGALSPEELVAARRARREALLRSQAN